jgi:hypothetical protein
MANHRKTLYSSRFSGAYLFFTFVINTTHSTWNDPFRLMSLAGFLTLRSREHINGFLAFLPKTDVQGNKSTGVIAGLLYTSHGAK